MARLPRYLVPGQPQHVVQRGNNRQAVFGGEQDYRFYLKCLTEACRRHGLAVHAYVLMTNHVHLLATPGSEFSLSKTMQSVAGRYAQYFNTANGRSGGLWEGRYRATPIDSERYFLACSRYIELNPVRAGIVSTPDAFPWSSYACHAHGRVDPLVSGHAIYTELGASADERLAAYRGLFETELPQATVGEIREATQKGWALGGEQFRERVQRLSGRRARPARRGRPPRTVAPATGAGRG